MLYKAGHADLDQGSNNRVIVQQQQSLAEAVNGWMHKRRLDVTKVARQGGLSRQTIYNLLKGDRPDRETLRKIARGMATSIQTDELDSTVYANAMADLFDAAGYDLPDDAPAPLQLEDEVTRLVRSRATAQQITRVLENYPNLHRDKRILLEAAIRNAIED